MRETFERELRRLHDDILTLGSMVEGMIKDSVDVLKRRDFNGSRRLIEYDRQVNHKRFAIEHDTLTLIATQQPMAGDMRTLAVILHIASELERMGDYAKGIAQINLMIGEEPLIKPLIDVPRMAEKACEMLHRVISGANSLWERGYGNPAPETVIVIGFKRQQAEHYFASCRAAGVLSNSYQVNNEESTHHSTLLVCRQPRQPWAEMWPTMRWFQ